MLSVILFPLVGMVSSCSEGSDEEGEFDNWQARNEAKAQEWYNNSSLTKYQSFAIDGTSSKPGDYIYVEVLPASEGKPEASTSTPFYTDTVRVAYRGRLIPSKSYPEGYVFDQSYTGDFSWKTAYVSQGASWRDGFATALLHMHVGDHWRVYIPYQLMYGSGSDTKYPAYSNMVFDVALFDFWHPGETRPSFKARSVEE